MNNPFLKYKGIHPGLVLARELEKRKIKQRPFSLLVGEYPQSFNAILKGRRNLPTPLALKIERELKIEEGTLVLLQAYYEIEELKQKEKVESPNLSILRESLFWDTNISKINWRNMKAAVIKRVFDKGNLAERKEITRFYGLEEVQHILAEEDGGQRYRVSKRK